MEGFERGAGAHLQYIHSTTHSKQPLIRVIDFTKKSAAESTADIKNGILPLRKHNHIRWINITGAKKIDDIAFLEKHFNLHPLVLEDVVTTDQRPKIEDYGDYLFMLIKSAAYKKENATIIAKQISIVFGHNFLISFQEDEKDMFENIQNNLLLGKGKSRERGTDYLAYLLMDSIVDNYFSILERFTESIEKTEERLIKNPSNDTPIRINKLKKELVRLRRIVWPLREVASTLQREESGLVKKTTIPYFRDVYDHTIQVAEGVEIFRETVSSMLDIYLSSLSNRMNEVMKVLTIIATIFIPLTFITGIYGMNFTYMPELHSQWGYPATLLIMVVIGALMLIYFKKKNWL